MMDFTPIVNAAIALAAAIVTAAAATVTTVLVPYIKSKTTAEQQKMLADLAGVAVIAAEQLFKEKKGEVKKEYALNLLAEKGVDGEKASALVEAAVYQLKNTAPAEAQ